MLQNSRSITTRTNHRPSANNAINKFYESRRAGNYLPLAFRRAAVAGTWFA